MISCIVRTKIFFINVILFKHYLFMALYWPSVQHTGHIRSFMGPLHHYLGLFIHFLQAQKKKKTTPFPPCTFLFVSFLPPSQCVVVCLRLLLCQRWLGEIWERQGSSLVTHQLWNVCVCRKARGETERRSQSRSDKEEDNKRTSSGEERWCSVDRRLEERGESDLMNSD